MLEMCLGRRRIIYLCITGLVKEKIWVTFFLPCSVQLSVCLWLWCMEHFQGVVKTGQLWNVPKNPVWLAGCSCCSLVPYTLVATGRFDSFCTWFFSSRHIICFVSCCWFRSTVSGPDALLLTVQQMLMIFFFCFMLFFSPFSLCFLLVQHSSASHMESVGREVLYWKLSAFYLLKMSPRQSVLKTLALVHKLLWHLWWR